MLNNPEILLLVEGCVNQNPKSQRELVDKFSPMLFTICLRYVGDHSKAKDVLQESYIRIFRAIKSFDSNKGSLQGWIRKITVNVALKQINKDKIRSESALPDNLNGYYKGPEIIEQMRAEDLLFIVQSLPDGYRQIFNLAVIEGYNHREIAGMLDIEEVTSRSQLSRAKQLLRKKLNTLQKDKSWASID